MSIVKLTDDIQLSSSSVNMGIDTSNILANYYAAEYTLTYTATRDCWAVGIRDSVCRWDIDGTLIHNEHWTGHTQYTGLVFLRKGQKISGKGSNIYGFKVYGLK